ncbi:UDP-glucose 4-epimerase GalE [bacterium]|nr:UDP-glucose 4-epimerase GalE [bacterium]
MADNKKILVIGGAGYIGSHTVINLLNDGKDIIVFDNLENGHIETVEALKRIGHVEFIKGDLRNFEDIEDVFKNHKVDAVVHFAAFALVGESVENPSKYYRNNVLGTLNLLDAMVKYGCKKIVFSSTCATYGNPKYVPVDEKHPQNPVSPYGASKLMVEQILNDYDIAYGLKSIKLRYFNVAGCDSQARVGEWHEPETHLVPNILKSTFSGGKTFKIFGDDYNTPDGTCIRDYVNVEDLADAHRLALIYLENENKSDVFNIGTERGDSVKNIFDSCEKVIGKKINVEVAGRRAGDAEALYANSKKAQTVLGWKSQRTIEDSISSAYRWEEVLQEKLNGVKV